MKVDLQILEETIRNEMLALATDALTRDGRFFYENTEYFAKKLQDNSIEIEIFRIVQYKVDTLSPEKKIEFGEKIKIAKESLNPEDNKFVIDDIAVEVKRISADQFIIQTRLVKAN